nr:hypothetical protein [uncultured Rhodopila sp.]
MDEAVPRSECNRQRHHVDIKALTGGNQVTVDLIAGLLARATGVSGADTETPSIEFCRTATNTSEMLHRDYIVTSDGFHGSGRQAIPPAKTG